MKRFPQKILFIVITSIVSLAYQPTSYAVHQHRVSALVKPTPTMKLAVEKIVNHGKVKLVFIKITNIKTNQPIRLHDLSEVHTQKIHMLVIDDSLSDYRHIHPVATSEPGVYQFSWQPKKKEANYRIWADVVPSNSQQQEYLIADLLTAKDTFSTVVPELATQSFIDGYTFKLVFEPTQLEFGHELRGEIVIRDPHDRPVHNLEPVMGAYAHFVGFNADFKSVLHIHSLGKEPVSVADRGGPQLEFHVNPNQTGFIKLFAQVKIKGKEIFVPFGIVVNPKRFSAT